ncbi:MAG: ethylbenzene dehydrogenase-related protein [Candidatus Caldarchaeum sp.]
MKMWRRRAMLRLASDKAKPLSKVDRFLLPAVAVSSLATALLAAFYRQFESVLRPAQATTRQQPIADIIAYRVPKAPISDPDSPVWENIKAYKINLADQTITRPLKTTVPKQPITVKAVYDDEWIAFLLIFPSDKPSKQAIKVNEFRDACAVLLARHPAAPEVRFMGTADNPATILHWKADWQADVEEGFQDIEKAFPNVAADFYPPLKEAVADGKPPKTVDIMNGAVRWLAGLNAGNPISEPVKKSPVEKIVGKGPGTIATMPTQDAVGWGRWLDGYWRVVLAKKLRASDSNAGEISLEPGNVYAAAFTVWFGGERDRGARKNPSMLQTLLLK